MKRYFSILNVTSTSHPPRKDSVQRMMSHHQHLLFRCLRLMIAPRLAQLMGYLSLQEDLHYRLKVCLDFFMTKLTWLCSVIYVGRATLPIHLLNGITFKRHSMSITHPACGDVYLPQTQPSSAGHITNAVNQQ